jgi:hypothetical protein
MSGLYQRKPWLSLSDWLTQREIRKGKDIKREREILCLYTRLSLFPFPSMCEGQRDRQREPWLAYPGWIEIDGGE